MKKIKLVLQHESIPRKRPIHTVSLLHYFDLHNIMLCTAFMLNQKLL